MGKRLLLVAAALALVAAPAAHANYVDGSIINEEFDDAVLDDEAEAEAGGVIEVVRAIRNIRSDRRVEPARFVEAHVQARRLRPALEASRPLIAALAAFVMVLFFLPCVLLGTISPIVAKLAVRNLESTGSTVGRIYAAGSIGSIAGSMHRSFAKIARMTAKSSLIDLALLCSAKR